jgi:glutaredoxin
MGIPTSAWGLLAYASLAAIVFIKRADLHWWAAWCIALFGVLYSVYLTTVSLTMIHAACPYCLTSLVLMTSVFALTIYQRPSTFVNFNWGRWLGKTVPVAAAIILLLHLNYTGTLGEAPQAEDAQTKALAIHLAKSGAKMYGAFWCPHCKQQKLYFGASAGRLPYVECSPDGQNSPQSKECAAAGIQSYPTWVINSKHIEEVMTPKQLADATGFQWPATSASN